VVTVVGAATSGIVFEIRELTLHDGPGVRTTVCLTGCPLACTWCHNPEGRSRRPQPLRSPSGSRVVGRRYDADELAGLLLRQADILADCEGGVTFSGGEPLAQARFVADVIDRLPGVHVALQTSGWGGRAAFLMLAKRARLVLFDLKLIDPEAHARWTGRRNAPILRNLSLLAELDRPFVVRVPLVPGVTDTPSNLEAIAATVAALPRRPAVELLPYNRAAGGKYGACGMTFAPGFDEDRPANADLAPFERAGLEAQVA
jgi:pyruvate formate lyase activating enzyme